MGMELSLVGGVKGEIFQLGKVSTGWGVGRVLFGGPVNQRKEKKIDLA